MPTDGQKPCSDDDKFINKSVPVNLVTQFTPADTRSSYYAQLARFHHLEPRP